MPLYVKMLHARVDNPVNPWQFRWAHPVEMSHEDAEKQNRLFDHTGIKYKIAQEEENKAEKAEVVDQIKAPSTLGVAPKPSGQLMRRLKSLFTNQK